MSCPKYKDFTRGCIKQYPALILYKDFKQCESDAYQGCIIYHILKSDFHCEHLDSCLMMFHEKIPEFLRLTNKDSAIYKFVTDPVYDFCLSKEKHTQCARRQMKAEGKTPPPGLRPDGKHINIADSILKQKISYDEAVLRNP